MIHSFYVIESTRNNLPVYFDGRYGELSKLPLWTPFLIRAEKYTHEDEAKEVVSYGKMDGSSVRLINEKVK